MSPSFYFYDLETSGTNPRESRIMQFAGQRTDMDLKPVGDPHNILVRMTDDTLPDPDAILITGITPQKTIQEGVSEAEFLQIFHEQVATPGTIFVGYNTVRFDDEFMRYLHYRNFYDPYEWQYLDGKSRWDLLDLVRMTRALRPDNIKWPVDKAGKPTNRLELITKLNGIAHDDAHDALSDVRASIDVARLIQSHQPKLFDFLLRARDKKVVADIVNAKQPFVYSSGKYSSEHEKTTVVIKLADHPKRQGALVYDLRHDPTPFLTMSVDELFMTWTRRYGEEGLRLPIKSLQYNRCPAVAPLQVLDDASKQRLHIDLDEITKHRNLVNNPDFIARVLKTLERLDERQQTSFLQAEQSVDAQLYDGFINNQDKSKLSAVRSAADRLSDFSENFSDTRLSALLPLYKARNYRQSLSDEERTAWEQFRVHRLMDGGSTSRMAKYFARLSELAANPSLSSEKQYLLEELQLYGQSIMPDEHS